MVLVLFILLFVFIKQLVKKWRKLGGKGALLSSQSSISQMKMTGPPNYAELENDRDAKQRRKGHRPSGPSPILAGAFRPHPQHLERSHIRPRVRSGARPKQ
jgi:hypothetical protein